VTYPNPPSPVSYPTTTPTPTSTPKPNLALQVDFVRKNGDGFSWTFADSTLVLDYKLLNQWRAKTLGGKFTPWTETTKTKVTVKKLNKVVKSETGKKLKPGKKAKFRVRAVTSAGTGPIATETVKIKR
jgi:hypothetical protein